MVELLTNILIIGGVWSIGFIIGWRLASARFYRRGLNDGKVVGALAMNDHFNENLDALEKKIANWAKEIQELTRHG